MGFNSGFKGLTEERIYSVLRVTAPMGEREMQSFFFGTLLTV